MSAIQLPSKKRQIWQISGAGELRSPLEDCMKPNYDVIEKRRKLNDGDIETKSVLSALANLSLAANKPSFNLTPRVENK